MTPTSGPSRLLIVSAYIILCIIWGTTWVAIKIGLQDVPPFTGASLRFALAAVVLLAIGRFRGVRFGTTREEKILWVINGIFGFVIAYGVVYWAEQWIPSGLASVLFATYPLFVTIIGHFIIPAERIGLVEGVGILAGFGGVGVIFSEDLSTLGGAQVAVAAMVMLASPVAAAISSVSIKRWGGKVHPTSLASVPMGIAALVLGGAALGFEGDRTTVWNATSVGALLYLVIFGSVITFSLYYWLLSLLPVKRMALIAYIIPIVAVIIGTLRGEPFTLRMLVGSALVIGAVSLATRPKKEP